MILKNNNIIEFRGNLTKNKDFIPYSIFYKKIKNNYVSYIMLNTINGKRQKVDNFIFKQYPILKKDLVINFLIKKIKLFQTKYYKNICKQNKIETKKVLKKYKKFLKELLENDKNK